MKLDSIRTWQQGQFIDGPKFNHYDEDQKQVQRDMEALRVRPGPTENAICVASTPEMAIWIAKRLNLAARLETKPIKRVKR